MSLRALRVPLRVLHRPKTSTAVGWSALGIAILAGSTSVTFAAALAGALSPLSMLFISESLMMLFTILSFGVIPITQRLMRLNRGTWMAIITVALSNSVIAPLLVFTGIRMTGPVNAELFIRFENIVLVILAVLLLRERMMWNQTLGALCIFAGVAIVALRGFSQGIALSMGDSYILLASIFYGCGGIVFRRHLHKVPPELVMFCRACAGMGVFFLLSPFMLQTLLKELRAFPMELIVALIGYGFFSRFLNLFCFYEAMERLPVYRVSLLLNLTIIASLAFANAYLGSPIKPYHIAGAGFILMGSVLMEINMLHSHKSKLIAASLKQRHRSHV